MSVMLCVCVCSVVVMQFRLFIVVVMMKIVSDISISMMFYLVFGVLGRIVCGGYSVQFVLVGLFGMKKFVISISIVSRYIQQLSMFRNGNIMLCVFSISGIRQLLKLFRNSVVSRQIIMIILCMVMNWQQWLVLIKVNLFGNFNCSCIRFDSMSFISLMVMVVSEYCIVMILWFWFQMQCVQKFCGV